MRARLVSLVLAGAVSGAFATPGAWAPASGAARAAGFGMGSGTIGSPGGARGFALAPGFSPGGLLSERRDATANVRVNDLLGDHLTPCTTQNETSLVALDANRIVVGFNDSGEGCRALDSYTGFAYSTDGGRTFTDGGRMPPVEGGFSGGDPSLAADRQGRVYFATLGNASGFIAIPRVGALADRSELLVYHSDDGGRTWSVPVDGTAGLLGGHDKELLAVDTTGGPYDGTVYLVWVDFSGGTGRGVIRFSRSTDRGLSFSAPKQISKNDNDYDMGPTPAIGPNGELYVIWQTQLTQTPGVYFAASFDGGETFSFPKKIRTIKAPGHPLACGRQGMKGEIRMLAWPVIAVDNTPVVDPQNPPPHRGRVYVGYASKDTGDEGNIYMISSTDRGATWSPASPSPGVRVNDDGTTRDQFMPAIAAKTDGEVALVWHDRRADANNSMIEIYASRSLDGGQTWAPNVKVSDVAFEGIGNTSQRDSGMVECYMGDYIQMVPHGDGYASAWGDNRDRYPVNEAGTRSDPNVYFASFGF